MATANHAPIIAAHCQLCHTTAGVRQFPEGRYHSHCREKMMIELLKTDLNLAFNALPKDLRETLAETHSAIQGARTLDNFRIRLRVFLGKIGDKMNLVVACEAAINRLKAIVARIDMVFDFTVPAPAGA